MKFLTLKNNRFIRTMYDRLNPSTGLILMLHRIVAHQSEIEDNRRLEITADYLEQTILQYQNNGYRFVNMDEVVKIQQSGSRAHCPYVCFTFDDGFQDNLTHALPVFKKYGVPFTLYVATGFPDRNIFVWWYSLENLVMRIDKLYLPDGSTLDCSNQDTKNKTFLYLKKEIQTLPNANARKSVQELFLCNHLDISEAVTLLNWEEIRQLHESGYCTIGSHGISHTSLFSLSADKLQYELKESKWIIEQQTGAKVNHFAYPYGHYNNQIAEAVRKCGYRSAVRIDGGMQRKRQNPYLFKRSILLQ